MSIFAVAAIAAIAALLPGIAAGVAIGAVMSVPTRRRLAAAARERVEREESARRDRIGRALVERARREYPDLPPERVVPVAVIADENPPRFVVAALEGIRIEVRRCDPHAMFAALRSRGVPEGVPVYSGGGDD
jgi:MFS superfamily sulfate permease-like transporter